MSEANSSSSQERMSAKELYARHRMSELAVHRNLLLGTIARLESAQVELGEARELLALVEQDLRVLGWKDEGELRLEREARQAEVVAEQRRQRDLAVAKSQAAYRESVAAYEDGKAREAATQAKQAAAQLGPDLRERAEHTAS